MKGAKPVSRYFASRSPYGPYPRLAPMVSDEPAGCWPWERYLGYPAPCRPPANTALFNPCHDCYITAARGGSPALAIFAGWSSPVARQAHNLKVVGSNPTPATRFSPVDQPVTARLPGFSICNGPSQPFPIIAPESLVIPITYTAYSPSVTICSKIFQGPRMSSGASRAVAGSRRASDNRTTLAR
jgi:hypothetical protein